MIVPSIQTKRALPTAVVETHNITTKSKGAKDSDLVKNANAFCFFDAIVWGDGIFYEPTGALTTGERIFVTAKLPGNVKSWLFLVIQFKLNTATYPVKAWE